MAIEFFTKPSRAEQDLKWANIWHSQFVAFHTSLQTPGASRTDWNFTADHVIVFLQSKRDAGMPAWKRAKIIHGLMVYRRFIADRPTDDLLPLKEKMTEIVVLERAGTRGMKRYEKSRV